MDDSDELMKQLGQSFGAMGDDVNQSFAQIANNLSLQMKMNNQLIKTVFVVLAIIGVVLACIIVFLIVQSIINYRTQKLQQQQFDTILTLVHEIQKTSFYQGLPTSADGMHVLPNSPQYDQAEVQKLAQNCEELGRKIDVHTSRQNNSKNVSELVFKISNRLGISKDTAMLYFCASMVYDAGFLSIPSDFFLVDILSPKERAQMKCHVDKAMEYLDFIPLKFLPIFKDAATMHHENMNGSGYPNGLQSDQIPQIARLIHVVESYVSLVSHRTYHKIHDKTSAIAELRRQPGIYDMDIVDALEFVA